VAVVIICMFRQYTCPILDSRSSDLIAAKWKGREPLPIRKTFPRRGINTEISPLRCASVEMTKGRGAL
jgi:hypothetical protein